MSARKLAVVLLVLAVAWMPMSGVAVQDASLAQDETDDEAITVSELNVVVLELENVTVRNLSVGSLNVSDESDVPSSVDDRDVTVSALLRDVRFENVTIRNTSLATELLGAQAQSLQERTENATTENETIETGQAIANVSLSNATIDGAVFESVVVENVTGNLSGVDSASGEGQVGDGNETGAQTNETGAEPAIEAASVTIGTLDTTAIPGEEAEEEVGDENATEAARGGASDDIIGDENLTEPSWAQKTGGNESDVTADPDNYTNASNAGTQIGGEVGEDLTAGNETNATATPAGNATESPTPDAADTPADNATESPSGNASLSFER